MRCAHGNRSKDCSSCISIVAAMFLPLAFLTGMLGVNVGGIPGAESPFGFLTFSLILVVLVALQLWYFIKKRWF